MKAEVAMNDHYTDLYRVRELAYEKMVSKKKAQAGGNSVKAGNVWTTPGKRNNHKADAGPSSAATAAAAAAAAAAAEQQGQAVPESVPFLQSEAFEAMTYQGVGSSQGST